MSETSQAARVSIARIKTAWREADADTRGTILFHLTGVLWMALAIVLAFGWPGALFCCGFGLWSITRNP